MADRILLESGAPDGYQLEDGTGVILMQVPADDAPDVFVRVGSTGAITAPLFTPNVYPTGQSVTASLGTAALNVSSTVSPTGFGLAASYGTPTAAGQVDHQENPTGYGLTASLGTPVVEVVALPSGQAATASLGTAPASASSSVSPTGYGTTADLGTPVEAVTALPTGLEATAALGTVSETVDSTVSPTGLAGTTELGTPSATGGSLVEVSGFGLTADLGDAAATSDAAAVSPTGYDLTMGLGTPSVGAVDGGAPPPATQGEPIGTKWQRRPVRPARLIQEPEVRQDAMVAVSGFAVSAQVGRTWQVADATIAPAGFQCYAQSNRAKATGMHNPTDAQIVDWLIQALNQSV